MFASGPLSRLPALCALLFFLWSYAVSVKASTPDDIYIFLVADIKSSLAKDSRFYDALANEFNYVGVADKSRPLRPSNQVLYVVTPDTQAILSNPAQANVLQLKSLEQNKSMNSSVGIDTTPDLPKIQTFLDTIFKVKYKLGFISEGTSFLDVSEDGIIKGEFEKDKDPYKSVNKLINYNRIDILLLSDNINNRATRRKIFINCLEQNRLAIGTKDTDVADGALASIKYNEQDVINAVVSVAKQYRISHKIDISGQNIKLRITINRSLANAKNLKPLAPNNGNMEITYE